MEDEERPTFKIYEDPEDDQDRGVVDQANEGLPKIEGRPNRTVLAEIILPIPSRLVEVQCDSGLKHEMMILQSEPLVQSTMSTSAFWTAATIEESKENLSPRLADGQPFKSSPKKLLTTPGPTKRSLPGPSASANSSSVAPLRI